MLRPLDPETLRALELLPKARDGKLADLWDLEGFRAELAERARLAQAAPRSPITEWTTTAAVRPDGSPLEIHTVRPRRLAPGPGPALLWFHGGGQVLGSALQNPGHLEELALAVGCTVAAVEYRLAPETPAPGAAEDGVLAYRHLVAEAGRLGLDTRRIGLAGESGGGAVAAAAALMIRDARREEAGRTGRREDAGKRDVGKPVPPGAAETPAPRLLGLVYPMLDDRNETPSSREITGLGAWDREENLRAWSLVLGERAGGPDVTPYEAPGRAEDLADMPPSFIAVGDADLFRDEDIAFASRLLGAGVPVDLHVLSGAMHVFDGIAPDSALTSRFRRLWHGWLRRGL